MRVYVGVDGLTSICWCRSTLSGYEGGLSRNMLAKNPEYRTRTYHVNQKRAGTAEYVLVHIYAHKYARQAELCREMRAPNAIILKQLDVT